MSQDKLTSADDETRASQADGLVVAELAALPQTASAAKSESIGLGFLAVIQLLVAIVAWAVTAERLYRYGGYVPFTRLASFFIVGLESISAIVWLWIGRRSIIKKVFDPGYWQFCLVLAVAIAVSWPVLLFWPRSSTLNSAVTRRDIRKAAWCLRLGADPNYESWGFSLWDTQWSRGNSPIQSAMENDDAAMVRLLLDRGVSLDVYGERVLAWAVCRGDTKLVARLLEDHVEPHLSLYWYGTDPLSEDQLRAIEAAAKAGAAVNWETLQVAITRGDARLVRILLSGRADPNEKPTLSPSESSLCLATRLGNLDVVEAMLQAGADPNVPGGHWHPKERRELVALEIAREQQNAELIRLLEQYGAVIPEPREPRRVRTDSD